MARGSSEPWSLVHPFLGYFNNFGYPTDSTPSSITQDDLQPSRCDPTLYLTHTPIEARNMAAGTGEHRLHRFLIDSIAFLHKVNHVALDTALVSTDLELDHTISHNDAKLPAAKKAPRPTIFSEDDRDDILPCYHRPLRLRQNCQSTLTQHNHNHRTQRHPLKRCPPCPAPWCRPCLCAPPPATLRRSQRHRPPQGRILPSPIHHTRSRLLGANCPSASAFSSTK